MIVIGRILRLVLEWNCGLKFRSDTENLEHYSSIWNTEEIQFHVILFQ